jgi:hypothetical protein
VAIEAGYSVMRGSFPIFYIFSHIVAKTTERRAFSIFKDPNKKQDQKKKKKAIENLLFPLKKPSLYLEKKI